MSGILFGVNRLFYAWSLTHLMSMKWRIGAQIQVHMILTKHLSMATLSPREYVAWVSNQV